MLDSKRILFVTGKGGVGKTTLATALAESWRRAGESVLLVEVDHARSSTAQLFGVETDHRPQASGRPGLHLANIEWKKALKATLDEVLPTKRISRFLMAFRVTRTLIEALPLAREMVLLRELVRLSKLERYPRMVVDLPASGHAVALFEAARSVQQLFSIGSFFSKQATEIQELFAQESSALILVSLAEEMSLAEVQETAARLEDVGYPKRNLVVLNHEPPLPFDPALHQAMDSLDETPSEGCATALRALADAQESARRFADARSTLEPMGSVVGLPHIAGSDGMNIVDGLAETVSAWEQSP